MLGQTATNWLAEPAALPAGVHLRQLEAEDRLRVEAVVDDWWGRPIGAVLQRPFFSCFSNTSFVLEHEGAAGAPPRARSRGGRRGRRLEPDAERRLVA